MNWRAWNWTRPGWAGSTIRSRSSKPVKHVLGVEAMHERRAQRCLRFVRDRARALRRDRHGAAGDALGARPWPATPSTCSRPATRRYSARIRRAREGGRLRAAALQPRDQARTGRRERHHDGAAAEHPLRGGDLPPSRSESAVRHRRAGGGAGGGEIGQARHRGRAGQSAGGGGRNGRSRRRRPSPSSKARRSTTTCCASARRKSSSWPRCADAFIAAMRRAGAFELDPAAIDRLTARGVPLRRRRQGLRARAPEERTGGQRCIRAGGGGRREGAGRHPAAVRRDQGGPRLRAGRADDAFPADGAGSPTWTRPSRRRFRPSTGTATRR